METNALPALPVPQEAIQLTWEFLIPVAIPLIVALVRRYIPAMPKLVVVVLAVLLSVLSVYLLNLSGWLQAHSQGVILPVLLGAAAIGVREIVKQILTVLGWYPKDKSNPPPPDPLVPE